MAVRWAHGKPGETRMRIDYLLCVLVLLGACRAPAQVITLAFISDPNGAALIGSGTFAGSLNLGTVQAFGGTVPSGVTKTTTANSWILSTPIDVQVLKVGLIVSSSYTLVGQLLLADVQNTWKWDSAALSTSPTTITTSGAYGTTASTLSLDIPFSAPVGTIVNTVNITAISN